MTSQFLMAKSSTTRPAYEEPRPIGVFWDIENLQVPNRGSVHALVERIRQYFIRCHNYREWQFVVVCDTAKIAPQILNDLNMSQVTVIHVACVAKNAADDKLKQQIKHFIDTIGYQSAILLITDDINFAPILSDYKNCCHVDIILIQRNACIALRNAADICQDFDEFCKDLPLRQNNQSKEITLTLANLPTWKIADPKREISKLTANCGGKKIWVNRYKGEATIKYGCIDDARRAEQRLNNYPVHGQLIRAKLEPQEQSTDSSDTSDEPQPEMYRQRTRRESYNSDHRQSFTSNGCEELLDFCTIHSRRRKDTNDMNSLLPNVNIPLPLLAKRIHRLLDIHGGTVPLKSFTDCYVNEFHEVFNEKDKPLIALDHLITCVPGVCIYTAPNTLIKRIIWIPNRDRYLSEDSANSEPTNRKNKDHWYNAQLLHFGKEVRELLKSHSHATIPFLKFVPSYHSHFVRQLCVGHFGCLKLSELLDEIQQIVQVYGENDQRMITLTHREQTKRFATDLIKILKSQDKRKIKLSEFPDAYEKIFDKPFDIADYGVCYFEDILRDVWEGTVISSSFGTLGDKWLELPKRDRSYEQKKKTTNFGQEVYELLKHSKEIIDFQLTFAKFIPCYHRYYNKQCRVNEFGFSKLIELLEELFPSVIDINVDPKSGEKLLRLNYELRVKALTYRFESILRHFDTRTTTVQNLEQEYQRIFKHKVEYSEYCAKDLVDLIDKMEANKMKIIRTKDQLKVVLIDRHHLFFEAKRIARILMEEPNGQLGITQLEHRYSQVFGQEFNSQILNGVFLEAFDIDLKAYTIGLTRMMLFARNCIEIMQRHRKAFTVEELDREHLHRFKQPLPQPTFLKCRGMCDLFGKLLDFFRIEKKKVNGKAICHISLDPQFYKRPLLVRSVSVIKILKRPGVDEMLLNGNPDLPLPDLVPGHQSSEQDDLMTMSSSASDLINLDYDLDHDTLAADKSLTVRSESPVPSTSGASDMTTVSMPVTNGIDSQMRSFRQKRNRIVAKIF